MPILFAANKNEIPLLEAEQENIRTSTEIILNSYNTIVLNGNLDGALQWHFATPEKGLIPIPVAKIEVECRYRGSIFRSDKQIVDAVFIKIALYRHIGSMGKARGHAKKKNRYESHGRNNTKNKLRIRTFS